MVADVIKDQYGTIFTIKNKSLYSISSDLDISSGSLITFTVIFYEN